MVSKKVNFQYFSKMTNVLFSTSQELSKDISHVTIGQFLRILKKKMHFIAQKGAFTSFLHLYELNIHEILHSIITFKIHNLLKYSLKFAKPKFL